MVKAVYSSTRRQGDLSDWQIYKRLLAYVVPYWYFFTFSLLGYLVYSLGNVLLADLMQFLLDAINETPDSGRGIISGLLYGALEVDAGDR